MPSPASSPLDSLQIGKKYKVWIKDRRRGYAPADKWDFIGKYAARSPSAEPGVEFIEVKFRKGGETERFGIPFIYGEPIIKVRSAPSSPTGGGRRRTRRRNTRRNRTRRH
jgi:hypothetical protein